MAQDLLLQVLDFSAARSGVRDADLGEEGFELGVVGRLAELEVAQGGEEAVPESGLGGVVVLTRRASAAAGGFGRR